MAGLRSDQGDGDTKATARSGALSKRFNTKVKLALVAPITSNIRGHGFEVVLKGKNVSGVVLCQQIRVIDFRERMASFVEKAAKSTVADVLNKVQVIVS